MCKGHWRRAMGLIPKDVPIAERRRRGERCSIAGCDRRPWAKDMCTTHYGRVLRGDRIDAPVKTRRVENPKILSVVAPSWALEAVRKRAKARGVSVSALLRAIVVRWAMTDGAEQQQRDDKAEHEAWRGTGYDMRSGS